MALSGGDHQFPNIFFVLFVLFVVNGRLINHKEHKEHKETGERTPNASPQLGLLLLPQSATISPTYTPHSPGLFREERIVL